MKNKIQIKKLSLNKETVTILNDNQLHMIKGGSSEIIITTLKTQSSQKTTQHQ